MLPLPTLQPSREALDRPQESVRILPPSRHSGTFSEVCIHSGCLTSVICLYPQKTLGKQHDRVAVAVCSPGRAYLVASRMAFARGLVLSLCPWCLPHG
ncbi:rCG51503 [Rattus norvegicus]|uniref:RCG51503 n=1 Tax=Rattus norvegicus TaxID=10116 RepID=A6IZT9_RAT|nr:rCG51503 [Rattus norvegicus]